MGAVTPLATDVDFEESGTRKHVNRTNRINYYKIRIPKILRTVGEETRMTVKEKFGFMFFILKRNKRYTAAVTTFVKRVEEQSNSVTWFSASARFSNIL